MNRLFAIAITFILLSTPVLAGNVEISAKDFAKEFKADKSLVIIDANASATYAKMHVQGAVNIPVKELVKTGDIEGLLKSTEELAAYFGSKGVSNASKIILYDDGSNKYTSRIYWVLKYLGANDVRILHKNMDEWKAARIMLTRAPSKPAKVTFTPTLNSKIFASTGDVKSKLGDAGTVILDARTEAEYKGTSTEKKSNGHIKGAIFLEYKQFLTDKGAFKSKEEIVAVAKKHGVTDDKTVIVYCATGVKAAVLYAALADIAAYPNVKLYDGSYNEWAADASNPLEK